jgi:hypothetical protein
MAGLELRLQTIRRAIQAFRDTPGRRGRFIDLVDCDEVLVGGDLHGHLDNFRRLMQRADLGHHPRRHLVLQELVHGPFHYPSGGDKSHQLVELVCALKCQFPRQVHYLIGNHELAQATTRSIQKNENDLNDQFVQGVRIAYASGADEMYALYLDLWACIPFALRTAGGLFLSHSLPSAGTLLDFDPLLLEQDPTRDVDLAPGGALYGLVWGRDTRVETLESFLRKVGATHLVSGHIPCDQGFERPSPRHIILDSQGSPAAYCLLAAAAPIEPAQWQECIHEL